jgi:hypothetical protein
VIFSKCPRCHSDRVRRGYRPTSVVFKLIGRYNLLCDNCNWEFTGFAIPGTVSAKPTKKKKKVNEESSQNKIVEESENNSANIQTDETLQTDEMAETKPIKTKRKRKVTKSEV